MTRMVFVFFACCSPTAVGMRQQSAAWGGGELRGSKNRKYLIMISGSADAYVLI